MGPNGKFIFQTPPGQKTLFIATGTGVAPFIAMIKEQLNLGNTSPMELIFGVRHQEDVFYHEVLEEIKQKHPNFSYIITLSQPPETSTPFASGRVTEHLKNAQIDAQNTCAYICGLKNMIDEVSSILAEKGLPPEQILHEKYD
jgi:ferredoxin-NADP reductase